MRSSKSRSRGKSNRNTNRSPAGNLNRVFDSSGPEGKVRGTPQQIIDKYTQLARDASLGNDRVAMENFQQHAEHYTRMLAEAQRDAEEKRVATDAQNRERQQKQQRERDQRDQRDKERRDAQEAASSDPAAAPQPDLVDVSEATAPEGDSGLVATPEAAPKPASRSRTRKPRTPKPPKDATAGGDEPAPAGDGGSTEAAE